MFVFTRFVTNSLTGVKLAEELCENPRTCMTVFTTESENEKNSVFDLIGPEYLINILHVRIIKRNCLKTNLSCSSF